MVTFDSFRERIYDLCLRRVGNPEDAQDLVQETFIRAHQYRHRFREDCSPYTWLYRIANNVCSDYWRTRLRKPPVMSLDDEGDGGHLHVTVQTLPDTCSYNNPETMLDQSLQHRWVLAVLSLLREDYREVMELSYVHGFREHEIAQMSGVSVGTIKSRLFRARRALRLALSEQNHAQPTLPLDHLEAGSHAGDRRLYSPV